MPTSDCPPFPACLEAVERNTWLRHGSGLAGRCHPSLWQSWVTARSFLGQTLFRPCGEQDGRQAPRGREQCTPRRPSKCSTALGRSGRGAEWGQDWYPKDGPPHGTWNPRKEKSSFCTVSSGTFYFPHFVSETLEVQEGE